MKALLTFFAALVFSFPALAQDWTIDPEKSKITFEGKQMGAAFTGHFAAPTGTITFDPAKLETGAAAIEVDITSVKTGNGERDGNILKPEWFNAEAFPKAKFTSTKFEKGEGENAFIAHGDLTIRDITAPVSMPFTFKTEANTATAEGSFTVDRLAYGVGQGEWKDTSMIGNPVTVNVSLIAHKAQKP